MKKIGKIYGKLFFVVSVLAALCLLFAACPGPGEPPPTPGPTPAATPTANPAAGAVAAGSTVSLSTTTSGASIYYTLDNSTPTVGSGILYNSPITITAAVTIKAIAVKSGMGNSAVMTAAYTIASGSGKAATPTASPASGTAVTAGSTVTLNTTTSGAEIRYTTDNSTPTESSTLYSSAITIDAATTIKAIAYKDGMPPSDMLTAAYTIKTQSAFDIDNYKFDGYISLNFSNWNGVGYHISDWNPGGDLVAQINALPNDTYFRVVFEGIDSGWSNASLSFGAASNNNIQIDVALTAKGAIQNGKAEAFIEVQPLKDFMDTVTLVYFSSWFNLGYGTNLSQVGGGGEMPGSNGMAKMVDRTVGPNRVLDLEIWIPGQSSTVDASGLEDAITDADYQIGLVARSNDGSGLANLAKYVPEADYDALTAAIAVAKAVNPDTETQLDVNNAKIELNIAVNVFLTKILEKLVPFNRADLERDSNLDLHFGWWPRGVFVGWVVFDGGGGGDPWEINAVPGGSYVRVIFDVEAGFDPDDPGFVTGFLTFESQVSGSPKIDITLEGIAGIGNNQYEAFIPIGILRNYIDTNAYAAWVNFYNLSYNNRRPSVASAAAHARLVTADGDGISDGDDAPDGANPGPGDLALEVWVLK
jgi:hypothetical protein